MADEKILMDGKEYISSGRAAKLVGYTKDYVGQLARDRKIDARRVGRNWYIEEKSIAKHKVSVHYNLTKPKKPTVEKENVSEKPIKNVEKINSTDIPRLRITHEEVLQRRVQNSQTANKQDDTGSVEDAINFLPQLKKKNRDVLLHSDIRYEHATEEEFLRKSGENESKKLSNNFYKEIPIRKPINRDLHRYLGSTQRVVRKQIQENNRSPFRERHAFAVDGIIVKNTRHVRQNTQRQPQEKTEPYIEHSPREHAKEHVSVSPTEKVYSEHSIQATEERSKVVPVVGSIILFTLVAVIYILFFSTGA